MNRVNLTLHTLNRVGRQIQVRLGTAGIAGAALLLTAAIGMALATRTHRETEWLGAAAEQARARIAQIGATRPVEDRTPAEQLVRFQQWFPPAAQATADLRVIFAAALAAHVDLSRGEYSVRPIEGSQGLERFDVILPVKERYAPVKAFVAEVLNKLPHASLDELRVERPGAAADQLESRVHFTLFYRWQAS
jgi:hypothetical protein